jgi:hypothetical protein
MNGRREGGVRGGLGSSQAGAWIDRILVNTCRHALAAMREQLEGDELEVER